MAGEVSVDDPDDFWTRLEAFARERRWRTGGSMNRLVDPWARLVTHIEAGYTMDWTELINDLTGRDRIEEVLTAGRFAGFDEPKVFVPRIQEIDDRLRAQFIPGVEVGGSSWPWWQRGILRRAGPEYVNEVKRLFGVDVEPI
jgi:hypothetical protein